MGEKYFVLFGIDGDEFYLINIVKDIEKGVGLKGSGCGIKGQWVWDTTRANIVMPNF